MGSLEVACEGQEEPRDLFLVVDQGDLDQLRWPDERALRDAFKNMKASLGFPWLLCGRSPGSEDLSNKRGVCSLWS